MTTVPTPSPTPSGHDEEIKALLITSIVIIIYLACLIGSFIIYCGCLKKKYVEAKLDHLENPPPSPSPPPPNPTRRRDTLSLAGLEMAPRVESAYRVDDSDDGSPVNSEDAYVMMLKQISPQSSTKDIKSALHHHSKKDRSKDRTARRVVVTEDRV